MACFKERNAREGRFLLGPEEIVVNDCQNQWIVGNHHFKLEMRRQAREDGHERIEGSVIIQKVENTENTNFFPIKFINL